MRLPRSLTTALIGTAAAVVAVTTLAPPASAYDSRPCVKYQDRTLSYGAASNTETVTLFKCPITQGHVPVRQTRSPGSPIVGYLEVGGSANWFVFQKPGFKETRGAYYNTWWASTLADNGQWGWVNETYFSGGGNDEKDGALYQPGPYVGVCCAPTHQGPWRI